MRPVGSVLWVGVLVCVLSACAATAPGGLGSPGIRDGVGGRDALDPPISVVGTVLSPTHLVPGEDTVLAFVDAGGEAEYSGHIRAAVYSTGPGEWQEIPEPSVQPWGQVEGVAVTEGFLLLAEPCASEAWTDSGSCRNNGPATVEGAVYDVSRANWSAVPALGGDHSTLLAMPRPFGMHVEGKVEGDVGVSLRGTASANVEGASSGVELWRLDLSAGRWTPLPDPPVTMSQFCVDVDGAIVGYGQPGSVDGQSVGSDEWAKTGPDGSWVAFSSPGASARDLPRVASPATSEGSGPLPSAPSPAPVLICPQGGPAIVTPDRVIWAGSGGSVSSKDLPVVADGGLVQVSPVLSAGAPAVLRTDTPLTVPARGRKYSLAAISRDDVSIADLPLADDEALQQVVLTGKGETVAVSEGRNGDVHWWGV